MKILVNVREVAVVDDAFEVNGLEVPDTYVSHELNEWDDYALESAVRIAESVSDAEVVTVTVGPERSEETVRRALAKGADRAVRVWSEELAALDVLDPAFKSRLLAAVAEDEDPELVLTGVQVGDEGYGATGVALARRLGYQWAAVVNDLELNPEQSDLDTATVRRELEGGVEELTTVDLPAVLTIQSGINEPRYASLRGIRRAQSKPLETVTPAALGVDPAALTPGFERTALAEPESETETTFFEGSADEVAGRLDALFDEQGVVEG